MVWEAYKVFWDRLPEQVEYQNWVGRCIHESVSAREIGHFFSQSEEHVRLVRIVSTYLCVYIHMYCLSKLAARQSWVLDYFSSFFHHFSPPSSDQTTLEILLTALVCIYTHILP